MAIYTYTAKNLPGKTIKGEIEANDKSTVVAALKEKGLFPIKVGIRSSMNAEINISFMNGVTAKDLGILCRQFAVMLNAGLPVLRILDILKQQLENKLLKTTIEKVFETVQQGNSLFEAMKEHKIFPEILLNMVRAGEASGNLEVVFDRMAVHFEKDNRLTSKVKGALTYPIIIACVAFGVIILLITLVVPTFVKMFSDMSMQLPLSTRIIIAVSDFIKSKWYLLLIIIAGLAIAIRQLSRMESTKKGLDGLKLKIPVIGHFIEKVACARFAQTLSTLLGAGLSMISALEITSKVVDNKKIESAIIDAIGEVGRGKNLSIPIKNSGVFPTMLVNMIEIGEDSGTLEEVLQKTAAFYDEEVEESVSKVTAMIEPLVIVTLSIVVGFIVISVVQPMFQMYGGF